MKKTVLIIMILTIFSKISGLFRDIFLSYYYGASYISDAYIVSITIPNVIFGFVIVGLLAGFIPMYSQVEKEEGIQSADIFTNNILNILLIFCTLFIFIVSPFTDQVVGLFASGFDERTLLLTSSFTKVSIYAIYFSGMIALFTGYLQIKGNFALPSLIGLPFNVFIVVSIYLSTKLNLHVLSYGFVIATAAQLVFLIPSLTKNNFRFKAILNFKNKHVLLMGLNSIPIILGASVNQINVLVDRTIASRILIGGVSALNYSSTLTGFIHAIFVWSITTAIFPMLSKLSVEKNFQDFKKIIKKSLVGVSILTFPITIGTLLFSQQLITLLYGRGAFDMNAVKITSEALFFYSFGIVGFGFRDILTKVFYSLHETKIPMFNAALGLMLNIVLNIILSRYLGIGGLALATSISATFTTILLFISVRKKIGPFGMKQISISFIKILFTSLVMGVFAKLSYMYMLSYLPQTIALLIAISVGVVSYFVIIYFMKIEDIDVIVAMIKDRFSRKI